jgi:hypothetical protein
MDELNKWFLGSILFVILVGTIAIVLTFEAQNTENNLCKTTKIYENSQTYCLQENGTLKQFACDYQQKKCYYVEGIQ